MVAANSLPVTADREGGYGDAAEAVRRVIGVEAVGANIGVGAVGANIEDQLKPGGGSQSARRGRAAPTIRVLN